MRDYQRELERRIEFIRETVAAAGADGVVFGNSGGKDSALVGILCKKAVGNVTGVVMPCQSKRNFGEDRDDGLAVAKQFGIDTIEVDLTDVKRAIMEQIGRSADLTDDAVKNIPPRLRMTTLYAVAQSRNCLVAGTGNRSEAYMGYFTKWGDGAYDFNPIADLTVTEIYEFLRFLNAPEHILTKAPSAGLFEGQTDEAEMQVTYREIDEWLLEGKKSEAYPRIERYHNGSRHKRALPVTYGGSKAAPEDQS